MKKIFLFSIIAALCFIGSTWKVYADSPGQNATSTVAPLPYTPLEPLPFVYNSNSSTSVNQVKDFSTIINGFFKLILAFGVAFAVVTLVIYGISYMTSEVAGKKAQARNRVQAALLGLFLLLGAYLILNAINPQLLHTTLFLPSVTAPGTTQNNQQVICNEYGVSTLCADGDNNYIEQQIQYNGNCQATLAAGAATCLPEDPTDLEYLADKQLDADRNECIGAYHGEFGQSSDSTQNCSTWDKKFDSPTPMQFNSCIAVPDPRAATPDSMSWWVCGYNQ